MPYATLLYSGLTPRLGFSGAVLSVSGGGRRHEVTLNNGQRWIVYSSGDIRCTHKKYLYGYKKYFPVSASPSLVATWWPADPTPAQCGQRAPGRM